MYQHISPISAPKIQELIQLLEGTYSPLPLFLYHLAHFRADTVNSPQPHAKTPPSYLKSFPLYPSARKYPWETCSRAVIGFCEMSESFPPFLSFLCLSADEPLELVPAQQSPQNSNQTRIPNNRFRRSTRARSLPTRSPRSRTYDVERSDACRGDSGAVLH